MALEAPWRVALDQAWRSVCAGSLGIGAVITDGDGEAVAAGRNRLMEHDAGEDHLAGTSLAHAEMNALAKVPWLSDQHRRLTLWTTLEPCLMCAGAIRLSRIAEVRYLVADPIFEGAQRARELNEFIASGWPDVIGPMADPLAVLGILFPAHLFAFWDDPSLRGAKSTSGAWAVAFPRISALAAELAASGELVRAVEQGSALEDVVTMLWERLVDASADLHDVA
jgi:tRNA(adenine34) deaminase